MIETLLRAQHLTGAGEQVGRFGMEREAAAEMALGFVETTALAEHGGEIVDDRRVVGRGAERAGEEADRLVTLAGLRQRRAVKEHQFRAGRRGLQRQAEPMLRVGEAALPQCFLAGADEISRIHVRHRSERSEKRFTKCLTQAGFPAIR
ncbi:MAG TPA: hypothetical protein VGR52_02050 [Stellaceae bacterium]|nr:hypothetical protein [Stellaceae bacterium]